MVQSFNPIQIIDEITPIQISTKLKKIEQAGRAIKTIKCYAQTWLIVWEWRIKQGYAIKNPVSIPEYGKAVVGRLNAKRPKIRTPWTVDDLNIFFEANQLYSQKRPENIWLPLLALYTGTRRESLSRLKTTDFKEYKPQCWSISFDPEHDKLGREREIPLHQAIINAGLINYINDAAKLKIKDNYIFPHLIPVKGSFSHYFGTQFSEERKKLKISKGADFHAFRTTIISLLAMTNYNSGYRRAFVGHDSGKDKSDVHEKNYVKGVYRPKNLTNEIFPFLDYSKIGFNQIDWIYKNDGAAQIKTIMDKSKTRESIKNLGNPPPGKDCICK